MDLSKRCFFIITGASKGIGKTMAIECCKKFQSGSLAILIARSKDALDITRNEIIKLNSKITVKTYSIDLSGESIEKTFEHTINDALIDFDKNNFELAFIIHNAGSVGDVGKKAKEIYKSSTWENYYKLNVFSVASLNSLFMKNFEKQFKLIVNITSKCGIEPFKSMTLYCSGKAAREMYFKVLAEEEENEGNTLVLNYSPGPVETDMSAEVQRNTLDDGLRDYFKQQRETKTILTTIQTTSKFLQIIENVKFKSGAHIDYFD